MSVLTYFFKSNIYMISFLDRHLPPELTDLIYKQVHQSYMTEICEIIKFKIVYTLYWDNGDKEKRDETAKISFLISERQNYYLVLL